MGFRSTERERQRGERGGVQVSGDLLKRKLLDAYFGVRLGGGLKSGCRLWRLYIHPKADG